MNKRGFTLIEMMAVVLIVGILATVALPQYQRALLKSRYVALMPGANALRDGEDAYFLMMYFLVYVKHNHPMHELIHV